MLLSLPCIYFVVVGIRLVVFSQDITGIQTQTEFKLIVVLDKLLNSFDNKAGSKVISSVPYVAHRAYN